MPEASQGVGSRIFSIPCSLFATKKGREILRTKNGALFSHFHRLYPSPSDKGSSIRFEKNIEEKKNLETRQFGEAFREPSPGSSPPRTSGLRARAGSCLLTKETHFISSLRIHTITWAVAKQSIISFTHFVWTF